MTTEQLSSEGSLKSDGLILIPSAATNNERMIQEAVMGKMGLLDLAGAVGVTSESALAMIAAMLSGLAGPDAWLEDSLGPCAIPRLRLLTSAEDTVTQELIERLTLPLEAMNRRLVQNMGRSSPEAIELAGGSCDHDGSQTPGKQERIKRADVLSSEIRIKNPKFFSPAPLFVSPLLRRWGVMSLYPPRADWFFPIEEAPVFASVKCNGKERNVRMPQRKALVAADTGDIVGIVGAGYQVFTNQQAVT